MVFRCFHLSTPVRWCVLEVGGCVLTLARWGWEENGRLWRRVADAGPTCQTEVLQSQSWNAGVGRVGSPRVPGQGWGLGPRCPRLQSDGIGPPTLTPLQILTVFQG